MKVESIASDGHIVKQKLAFISEQTHMGQKRSILHADDLLFSIAGTIGRVARVDAEILPGNTNQALAIIRPDQSKVDVRFLMHCLRDKKRIDHALSLVVQSVQANLSLAELSNIEIPLPPLSEQRAIAEVLGALDDKIAANIRIAAISAELSGGLFEHYLHEGSVESLLSEITSLVSRGVTPAYSEDAVGTTTILNQKCVRDQRVSLGASRNTLDSKVREDKILRINDVLVNSTGQGTLGRVARWTRVKRVTTDSHISIVRFDATKTNAVTAGYALLRMQPAIEELGEGSTGQTELSRVDLGRLRVRLPARDLQDQLGVRLLELSRTEDSYLAENETLAVTRDALLPQLMSGKLRVRDAEKLLAGVL